MSKLKLGLDRLDLALGGGAALAAGIAGFRGGSLLLIAASVIGANVLLGVWRGDGKPPSAPLPDPQSLEGRLLSRGHCAAAAFAELAGALPRGLLADRSGDMRRQAITALDVLIDLARQSARMGHLLEQLGGPAGKDEKDSIRRRLARADGRQRTELRQSLTALETRAEVRRNLADTKAGLRTRMETVTLGLEVLVARLAELVALAQAGSLNPGDDRIEQLALELRGLREGLVQAEDVSALAAGLAAGRDF